MLNLCAFCCGDSKCHAAFRPCQDAVGKHTPSLGGEGRWHAGCLVKAYGIPAYTGEQDLQMRCMCVLFVSVECWCLSNVADRIEAVRQELARSNIATEQNQVQCLELLGEGTYGKVGGDAPVLRP